MFVRVRVRLALFCGQILKVLQAGDFYNGATLHLDFSQIKLKFYFRVRLKPSNDQGEFELD